jgi:predicted dehydrogenase
MSAKMRFGLVGYGNIGKRHAEIIQNLGVLTAICDSDLQQINEAKKKYQVQFHKDFNIFLNQKNVFDIVVICTPNYLHASQTIKALNSGFHVICEKPMALTSSECQEMKRAAYLSNRILYIVKQNRFNPPITYLKKILEEGILGKIYSISMNCLWNREHSYYLSTNWRGKRDKDGGILFTQFSHFFDITCYLFGSAKCIAAKGKNFAHKKSTEFEDTIVTLMEFDNEILASMHFSINAHKKNMEGSLTIISEKGSIKIGGEYLNTLEYHEVNSIDHPKIINSDNQNDYRSYKGSMNNHSKVYNYILKKITNPSELIAELETSIQTIRTIESVKEKLLLS